MRLSFGLSVLVSTAFAASIEHPKLKRATGNSKPDGFIVKLKNGASRENSIAALTRLAAPDSICEVGYDHWTVINGYSARLSGACLQHVLTDSNVEYVEEDGIFTINHAISPRSPSPAPNPVPGDAQPNNNDKGSCNGEGATFYGIDTGILISHKAFSGRAVWGATFGPNPDLKVDDNGHGTHTAGTAAGVGFGPATASKIVAVKVLSADGSGSFADVISGIDWSVNDAVKNGQPNMSVVNMSLGGAKTQAVDDAVESGIGKGVHFTIAAGNSDQPASGTSPASAKGAVTVGAADSKNQKACFSNYGPELIVWDLGVGVLSAWNTGDDATATASGTSMAAPGVNGKLLVALSDHGSKTPTELIKELQGHAKHAVQCNVQTCDLPINLPVSCDSLLGTTDLLAQRW